MDIDIEKGGREEARNSSQFAKLKYTGNNNNGARQKVHRSVDDPCFFFCPSTLRARLYLVFSVSKLIGYFQTPLPRDACNFCRTAPAVRGRKTDGCAGSDVISRRGLY